MATMFVWAGKTSAGVIKTGEMSAGSRDELISILKKQGLTPTSISEKKAAFKLFSPKKQKITEKDLVIFTRQFSTMFTAGIPIVQALEILAKQIENRSMGDVISQIKSDVETGSNLADALKKHKKLFDDLYVNLVAAGEAGGILDEVLLRLAGYIEKNMKLKKKVKGAMIYPIIVMSVAVVVIAIIMVFVIPIFAKIFGDVGAQLPAPTRSVIWLSHFLSGFGGVSLGGGLFAAVLLLKQYRKTETGHKKTDEIILKLPVFGNLLKKVAVARFTRTLGTLLNSGVPILDALEICARSSGNKVVEEIVMVVRGEVAAGKSVSEPLSKSPVFPSMVCQMISVGEATGSLDHMLVKISDFYDDEVDMPLQTLPPCWSRC